MSHIYFFTPAVVIAGLLIFATPVVHAQPKDNLIKGSGPAVYYNAPNGKRYVFTTEAVYKSWYPDYSQVGHISDAQLATIPLGGNVTMRPGAKLIKTTTSPHVYAVSRYGVLHWITTEDVAAQLYGANWNKHIIDIPDAFFVNYIIGNQINRASQYAVTMESAITRPDDNIRPNSYQVPTAPETSIHPNVNPATISMTLSTSHAVLHQIVHIQAKVSHSNLPITRIEIRTASQPWPVEVCLNSMTCAGDLNISTEPMTETYTTRATDSAGTTFEIPTAKQPILTVSAPNNFANMQISASPLTLPMGSRTSYTSKYTGTGIVKSHKIYAIIPGVPTPVLWRSCTTKECSGSSVLYRTTSFYGQVVSNNQTYFSSPVQVNVLVGNVPKPILAITGHPAANQTKISVTGPSGETIGQTWIQDGTTLQNRTLAKCSQSSCSVTLQVNVPETITAFTFVGGKYEASNTITVTP